MWAFPEEVSAWFDEVRAARERENAPGETVDLDSNALLDD